ncbi:MAG: Single-stranded-DNA-specific exonuclease RecJ [Candidatus Uhrbacteria bacterium GW2011_GWF2_41_16]|uniref:Single-stranded-DNA-specific exonuclease RecJ n=2 Tax=Candidatus Uhriibacteriota TaxID=1752732 RepID=A0A0G0V933_9BACT|nr:MAG: Single-stranded-DNA-specific exonuclease RecJ [Candidatus Uhrbacteria bacterium GW2011_GWC2_41_11]KKR97474.1 MAG: Single-stranded-DNA-specific exonuclease RecJ [Candidatus Uhrbacteria bacterium GW2011_GWF2_41_16]HBP00154.1 single-stranded-DNA-specific exonuclease RecJ [Candidatus Uhrbacteria bacterium]
MTKRWCVAETISEDVRLSFPEYSSVLLQLLWNRNQQTQDCMDIFLGPDWNRDTCDPFLFQHISRAVERTFTALEQGEKIVIHGDYDADGVCGSAVLLSGLRDICRACGFDEHQLSFYIPHREKEGYGFSPETAEHLYEQEKANLIITVDCGISNAPAIARAKALGIDTIICDHHTVPDLIPQEAILLHPLVPGEIFPNKHLCGTGVAFKFVSALFSEARKHGADFPEGYEKWLLDLVAIATVTDVMPLQGENRVLEMFGLLVLNKTRRIGLQKLFEVAGIIPGKIDTWTIGFQIGPRLNAAGRMHHASVALELLLSEDSAEATRLAGELHETNLARQKASEQMYQTARAKLTEMTGKNLLVAVEEGWSAGLVGLVAGKLLYEFHRPVFVVGKDGEKFVASGRSIPGFDITQALQAAAEHLDRFGGHPQACGFSTTGEDRFLRAVEVMTACADEILSHTELTPQLLIEAEVNLEEIGWPLFQDLQRFEPFGEGNRVPIFCTRNLEMVAIEYMGKDEKHARFLLKNANGMMKRFVAFGFGTLAQTFSVGMHVDVAYEVGLNEWKGNREIQLKVVDLVPNT